MGPAQKGKAIHELRVAQARYLSDVRCDPSSYCLDIWDGNNSRVISLKSGRIGRNTPTKFASSIDRAILRAAGVTCNVSWSIAVK